MQGLITYKALPPAEIEFTPLKQSTPWRADRLLEHYAAHDQRLRRYVPLIQARAWMSVPSTK